MSEYKASVKVMRSYDYCHFECSLGTDEPQSLDAINRMRQEAAALVDEAVRQYRQMKAAEPRRVTAEFERGEMKRRLESVKAKPEGERTINEVALLRDSESTEFWSKWKDEEEYDYYDPEREYHFSMLGNGKKTVRA